MVNITVRVLSRPSVNSLATIYRELGTDYDECVLSLYMSLPAILMPGLAAHRRVLPSIVNEVLKGVTAQFNASQLISSCSYLDQIDTTSDISGFG